MYIYVSGWLHMAACPSGASHAIRKGKISLLFYLSFHHSSFSPFHIGYYEN